jgi:hypothetical protein
VIVTVTGAYKNAGDHLIGWRARELLRHHVDPEVVNVDRKSITDEHYEMFNRSRAVLLTGGPAYQRTLYPGIYPLDLDRVKVPVIPYGLGWRDRLGAKPEDFHFEPAAKQFLLQIHSDKTRFSSARCPLTMRMLSANSVENALMTGCPAWYDEPKLDLDFQWPREIRRIVFTAPANKITDTAALLRWLRRRFPRASIHLVFQAGLKSTHSKRGAEFTRWNIALAAQSALAGIRTIDASGSDQKLRELLSSADLHIGYRVHSHLFCVSQRIASILVAEDTRGEGQNLALNLPQLTSKHSLTEKQQSISEFLDTSGSQMQAAVEQTRKSHSEMLRFLKQL